jgi:hypothetical protein
LNAADQSQQSTRRSGRYAAAPLVPRGEFQPLLGTVSKARWEKAGREGRVAGRQGGARRPGIQGSPDDSRTRKTVWPGV